MRIKQIAALAPTLLGLGLPSGTPANPQVLLRPDVVARGHASSIEVTGVRSRTLQVRLVGASANSGRPIPWTPLHLAHGIWHAKLEMPELRGIYPVELRVGRGARILRSDEWLLRVFAKGTFARPSFDTPEDVARWWVQNIPGGAKLVALKRWPRPAFDRRDPRLHRLLVLAYSPTGHPGVHDRGGSQDVEDRLARPVRSRAHAPLRNPETPSPQRSPDDPDRSPGATRRRAAPRSDRRPPGA